MKKYYIYFTRNFNNEYRIIQTETEKEEKRLLNWYKETETIFNSLERITCKQIAARKKAEKIAKSRDYNYICMNNINHPYTIKKFFDMLK